MNDLYRLGFLGNYLPLSKTYRWQHKGDDNVILSDEWRLMIHHALDSALSIGSKQDYGLKRNDPPQIGDVVEATVLNVGISYVIVEFEKNNKRYVGSIHISQLADKYIRFISDEVSVGDIFKSVILGYDPQYSKWRLSKKAIDPATFI